MGEGPTAILYLPDGVVVRSRFGVFYKSGPAPMGMCQNALEVRGWPLVFSFPPFVVFKRPL